MRVSASCSIHLGVRVGFEHTFSVFAVGSFFTVLTVVPSLAIVSSVITVSLAVPIDRASRPSAVVDVPISSTVITLASIILAWGVFASAWWRW